MNISLEPVNKNSPDDQNILADGVVVGMLYLNRNKPKPGDIIFTVRDLTGRVAIVPDEKKAIDKLLVWATEDGSGVLFNKYQGLISNVMNKVIK